MGKRKNVAIPSAPAIPGPAPKAKGLEGYSTPQVVNPQPLPPVAKLPPAVGGPAVIAKGGKAPAMRKLGPSRR